MLGSYKMLGSIVLAIIRSKKAFTPLLLVRAVL